MNLRALDLNLLVVLDVLLAERHVTRAGKRLGLSQPATSNALERLRRLFNDALLERGAEGLELTVRARALRDPLSELLRSVSTLVSPARIDLKTLVQVVRLSIVDYGISALLPAVLQSAAEHAPGLDLACLPWTGAEAAHDALIKGDLDLAISVPAPSNLRIRPLLNEKYVVAMRAGHPAAALTLARWLAYPHVVVSGRGSPSGPLDTVLAERGLVRRVGLVVPSFLTVPELLKNSDLLALVPEQLVKVSSGLVWSPPPVAVPGFEVVLTWHPRCDTDVAVTFVRDQLTRAVQATEAGAAPAKPRRRARAPAERPTAPRKSSRVRPRES
jgi:DNA-binding transcriptional LysR family regulator